MAPPTLLTPLPPGAPPPPMPRPSAAALAAYRPDVPVLAPLPQYAPLPEIVRAPPPPRPVLRTSEFPPPPCKFWSAPGGCRNGSACRFAHPVAGRAPSYAPPPQYAPMPPAPPRPTYAPPPPRPAPPPPPQKFSNDGSFLEAMKRKLAAPAPVPAEEEAAPPPAKRQASAAAKARRMKKKAEAPPAAAPRGSGRTTPAALALSTLDEEEDDIAPIGYDGNGARRGEEALWSAKAEAAALKEATRRARCALRRAEAPPAPAPTLVEQALDAARDASPS